MTCHPRILVKTLFNRITIIAFAVAFVLFAFGALVMPTPSYAALGTTVTAACGACPNGSCPCDKAGKAQSLSEALTKALNKLLTSSSDKSQERAAEETDDMVEKQLTDLNETELGLIDGWKAMWKNNLLPALQSITQQLNVAQTDQANTLQSADDAETLVQNRMIRQGEDIEAQRNARIGETACTAATIAGGYSRANVIPDAMRQAWERETLAIGLNHPGTVGANGIIGVQRQRYEDYKNLFCDPNGNGGDNRCGSSDPNYYNADTLPSKFIYDKLTIDVKDPKMVKTIDTITNNMIGVPAADVIQPDALTSATGQEVYLQRRSYLARHAAISTIPHLITGWRLPGSQMGEWVKGLREGAGIPLFEISSNPSYREIIHATAIDRFNNGRYAVGMIGDQNQIEMEKLNLDVLYLMQLRDYHELLERTALTLAVQLAMMADEIPLPETAQEVPLR